MLKLFLSSAVTLLVLVSVAGEFRAIPSFSNLRRDEKREIFYYEHKIVIRDSGAADDKVRRCEFVDVYFEDEKDEAFSQLKKLLNLDVKEVLMDKMMDLIKDCDSVDETDDNINPELMPETESVEDENSGVHIIIPGTNWCGTGNIAKSYHDLGKIRNVDRCCRSHDQCPIFIRAKDEMYNLTNNALYTKSHCRCDEALYDCLKKDNGFFAKLTGNLYFDILRTKCIVGLPENTNEEMKIVSATRHW